MEIKLSACTIARNEARNIVKSINSYKEYVDEIVIIDTGSIDDTVEVAKKAGAKVLNYEWVNDFSEAKNFALDNCSGDWVIFLDADEWFDGNTAANIKQAINTTIKEGYSAVACKLVNFADETEILEVGSTLRVFKHDKNIRFERAIHEVLFDKIKNEPLPSLYSDLIVVNHSGYMRKVLANKAKRNKMLLDKTFAAGKSAPIDYFYGLRENLNINVEMADYFYKLIKSIPDYREKISQYNIGPILDDNMIKLVNKLPNKYSFEERLELLKNAQKIFPENPIFKYYEYNMFYGINRKRAILALQDAVKLSSDFEKKHPDNANSFYSKAGDAFTVLGEYELLTGDKSKALGYFVNAVKFEYSNLRALLGILYIIGEQKNEDIVIFINSIYNTEDKEVLKFLEESLRLTRFHDTFLYYFVKYNKKFNEVDSSFFTSRLIMEKYDDIIDVYMNVFNESKDIRALIFVASAIIIGNRKEKYTELSGNIAPSFSKIINAYFNEGEAISLTENEYPLVFDIFKELAFLGNEVALRKYITSFRTENNKIWLDVIDYYFNNYSYDMAKRCIDWVGCEELEDDDIWAYTNFILTSIYFREGRFEEIEGILDKAIEGGYFNIETVLICELLEADDEKLKYYFSLFDAYTEMKKLEKLDKICDISSDNIFFLNIDKFCEEIKDNPIRGVRAQIKELFEFANIAKSKRAFAYAEKYYKIALKFNYCVDKCYFELGEIYNHFNKPDLSFYCYEKAFCENLLLANKLLPKEHRNYNYVFSKKKETYNKLCPICGKEGRQFLTFCNIDDNKLDYDFPLITGYMKCEECKHIFLKNEIKEKNKFFDTGETICNEREIESAYRIFEQLEKVSNKKDVITFSDNKYLEETGKNKGYNITKYSSKAHGTFNIALVDEYITNSYDIKSKIKNIVNKLEHNGIAIFNVFDAENAYSTLADRPLWAKVGVQNVFTQSSIKELLDKVGMKVVKIETDYINKGKIIVIAKK